MSNIHTQNCCWKKRSLVSDQLQSQASKGKSIILTASNHRVLIAKGIQILSAVNETSANEDKLYALVGGLELKELK